MSATGEGEAAPAIPVEQPAADVAAAGKPVKEKKPKAPKEKKPKSAKASHPAHPPYFQMIKEALLALHEKSGSSPYAIAKYMEQHHKAVLPGNYKKMLGLQLKNCATKGKLIKIKASYKLAESGKKEKEAIKNIAKTTTKISTGKKSKSSAPAAASKAKTTTKVKVTKKPATPKKAAKPAKKMGVKKSMKKATPVKPKQPKSIKSPVAKRAAKKTMT